MGRKHGDNEVLERKASRGVAILLTVMLCALGFTPQAWAAEEPESPRAGETAPAKWVGGTFETGVDYERSSEDADIHLDQILRIEAAKPGQEKLKLRGSLWMTEDLDGDEDKDSALRGIDDSYDSSVRARLLYLYLESKAFGGDSTLRVGRQRILESPAYNRLDGLYFKKRLQRWDWYVFGGARASLYEDAHDDRAFGGGVSMRATARTRLSLDLYYGKDRYDSVPRRDLASILLGRSYPRKLDNEVTSTLVAFTVSHQLTPEHTLYGRYTFHDGDSDELQLSATGVFSARDVVYNVTYRRRLEVLEDRANDVTGFYRILGGYNEYDDVQGTLHVPLNQRYTLSLEGQLHLSSNDDEQTGNRDFQRLAAILNAEDLKPGLDASVALEYWNVDQGAGSFAVTGEVAKEWEKLRLRVGVDYERFKDRVRYYRSGLANAERIAILLVPGLFPGYRPFIPAVDLAVRETHENVYSAYARLDYALNERSDIWAKLSLEEDDGPDSPYWRLRAVYSLRF